jgi:hypothetical protein
MNIKIELNFVQHGQELIKRNLIFMIKNNSRLNIIEINVQLIDIGQLRFFVLFHY